MGRPRKDATGEQLDVIERHDPADDAAIDGDPSFNFKLKQEGLPDDKVAVWVHRDAIRSYKGRRWTEVRAGELGVEFLADRPDAAGEPITEEDHTLMVRDRAYHERILQGERLKNRHFRLNAIKDGNKTIYVNAPGDGPRAMDRR